MHVIFIFLELFLGRDNPSEKNNILFLLYEFSNGTMKIVEIRYFKDLMYLLLKIWTETYSNQFSI